MANKMLKAVNIISEAMNCDILTYMTRGFLKNSYMFTCGNKLPNLSTHNNPLAVMI